MTAKVGIISDHNANKDTIDKLSSYLDKIGIVHVQYQSPMIINNADITKWLEEEIGKGMEAIIVCISESDFIAHFTASQTTLPIIALPLSFEVRSQFGYPMSVVGLNQIENAVILAARILSIKYPDLKNSLIEFIKSLSSPKTESGKKEPLIEKVKSEEEEYLELFKEMQKTGFPIVDEKTDTIIQSKEILKKEYTIISKPSPLKTKVLKTDAENPDDDILYQAYMEIIDGGIIAFPTDTVYGLAVDASNKKAVEKLYQIKQREENKPLAIFIHKKEMLSTIANKIDDDIKKIIAEFWPGALTLVVEKKPSVFESVTQDQTIGIRIPSNTIVLKLLNLVSRPLAVTSANLSSQPPAKNAQQVIEYFEKGIALVINAGEIGGGIVSTVLHAADKPYKILREGAIPRKKLERYIKID